MCPVFNLGNMHIFSNRILSILFCLASLIILSCGDDEGSETDAEITYTASVGGVTTASEGDQGTGFRISLDKINQTGSGIVIPYQISGTATAGDDFQAPSGSATIADGNSEVTVDIPFIDDTGGRR